MDAARSDGKLQTTGGGPALTQALGGLQQVTAGARQRHTLRQEGKLRAIASWGPSLTRR